MKTYYFAVNPDTAYGGDNPICVDRREANRLIREWYCGEDETPEFEDVWSEASDSEISEYGVYDTLIPDSVFAQLWGESLTTRDRDTYVSDWALSSIWEDDPESEIPQERIEYLTMIWDAAHMSVKDICKAAGLTQAGLAQRFCIPKRTVEDWCRGVAKCADYIRLMMADSLGLIKR